MADANTSHKTSADPVRLALVVGPETMPHIGGVVQHLTVGLLDEPFAVTVLAPVTADLADLPSPPVEILHYEEGRRGRLRGRTIETLASQLSQRNVELLHALDGSAHATTRKLSDTGQWPYVVSVLGTGQCKDLAPLGSHCQAVLAASTAIRSELERRHIAPSERIHLARPGVHHVRRVTCFTDTDRSRAVIVGGNLDAFDIFDAALNAFAALRDDRYECVFFLLGNGKAGPRLRRQAQQLQLMHAVTFVDRIAQHQMADIFKAADIFVYPRSNGLLETEVMEAMAAGIPVLVGDECVGDFVSDAETAMTYSADSAEDLTAKLKILLDEPDAAVNLAGRALVHLRQHHSPAAMVAAMADLYRRHALPGRTLKIA